MPRLHPVELTDAEVTALMRTFIKGKRSVLEDDCMAVVRWATAQRMGAFMVDLMIEGKVRPVVKNGEVMVELAEEPTA